MTFAFSGNGLLWKDDKQIVEGHFWAVVDRERPRVEVLVEERAASDSRTERP